MAYEISIDEIVPAVDPSKYSSTKTLFFQRVEKIDMPALVELINRKQEK